MEIPARQVAQVGFAPQQRDYSPMMRAEQARQQFYSQAFQEVARISTGIIQRAQSNRLAETQIQAREFLMSAERQYRTDLVNLRSSAADPIETQRQIDQLNATYRDRLVGYADEIAAPGVRRRFNQWAQSAFDDFRLSAEIRANTELQALEQQRLFVGIEREAGLATRTNMPMIAQDVISRLAEAQADGTISPSVFEQKRDEALMLIETNALRASVREMMDMPNATADSVRAQLIDNREVFPMVADSQREQMYQYAVDIEAQRREEARQVIIAGVNEAQSQIGDRIQQAIGTGGVLPTITEIQNDPRLAGNEPEQIRTRQSLVDSVLSIRSARAAESERERAARERGEEEQAGIEAEAARAVAARQITDAFVNPDIDPFTYQQMLYQLGPQAGLTETEIATRVRAVGEKNMSPEVGSLYNVIDGFFAPRLSEAERQQDTETLRNLNNRYQQAIEALMFIQTSEFTRDLPQAERVRRMEQAVQNMFNDELARELNRFTNIDPVRDQDKYLQGQFGDALMRNDVENVLAQIAAGAYVGSVEQSMPQLEVIASGTQRLLNNIFARPVRLANGVQVNARLLEEARPDPLTGQPTALYAAHQQLFPERYRFTARVGDSTVPAVSLSIIERDKDTVLAIWDPYDLQWVPMEDRPQDFAAISRANGGDFMLRGMAE